MRDHRLETLRQQDGHAAPPRDAQRSQRCGKPGRPVGQLLVGQAAMRAIRTEMFEADPIRRARGPGVADRTADIEVLRNVPDEIPDKLFVSLA